MSLSVPTILDELRAVNVLLTTIGEAPINSLEGTNIADVTIARNILEEVSVEVQEEGWNFNTEKDFTLTPDINNEILLPNNVARVHYPLPTASLHPTQRGEKLYNKAKNTYTFDDPVDVTITFILPFEEIPQAARRYITLRASRIFADRMIGGETMHQVTAQDEQRARARMKSQDLSTGNYNMFNHTQMFRALRRSSYGTY